MGDLTTRREYSSGPVVAMTWRMAATTHTGVGDPRLTAAVARAFGLGQRAVIALARVSPPPAKTIVSVALYVPASYVWLTASGPSPRIDVVPSPKSSVQ